jgi:hypothetical protein
MGILIQLVIIYFIIITFSYYILVNVNKTHSLLIIHQLTTFTFPLLIEYILSY